MENDHSRNAGNLESLAAAFYDDGRSIAARFSPVDHPAEALQSIMEAFYSSLNAFIDLFTRRAAASKDSPHCRKGCAWCCHQAVFASTHEFWYLQRWIENNLNPDQQSLLKQRARKKHLATSKMTEQERLLHKAPCPLLEHDSCMVYDARPVACRIYLSRSLDSCIKEYNNPGDTSSFPELFDMPFELGRKFNAGLADGLKEQGMEISEYGMEAGLLKMHSVPGLD